MAKRKTRPSKGRPATPPVTEEGYDAETPDPDESADESADVDYTRLADIDDSGLDRGLDDDESEETGIDRIVGPEEAGLGGGLDQAEEARLGITDEELAKRRGQRFKPS